MTSDLIKSSIIIDCLKFKKHATHLNFKKSLFYINKIKPKKTIFVGACIYVIFSAFFLITLEKNTIPFKIMRIHQL